MVEHEIQEFDFSTITKLDLSVCSRTITNLRVLYHDISLILGVPAFLNLSVRSHVSQKRSEERRTR